MQERCLLGDIEFFRCECCGESRAFILGDYSEPHDLVNVNGVSVLATEIVWAVVDSLEVPAGSLHPLVSEFLRAGLTEMQSLVDGLSEKLSLLSDASRAPGAGSARGVASEPLEA